MKGSDQLEAACGSQAIQMVISISQLAKATGLRFMFANYSTPRTGVQLVACRWQADVIY